jgi:acyl dehydratase
MNIPLQQRWFEDYRVGESFLLGDQLVSEQEIVDFARRYDPQPFHVDAEAAAASHFGGIVASGWMTASLLMRILCDNFIAFESSMGSPGVDQLRWLEPVRPGDRLRARVSVLELKPSRSKPDRGAMLLREEALNQHDRVVMSLQGWALVKRRP